MHAAIREFLEELDDDQEATAETAYDTINGRSVESAFQNAENVAEDFYEDYRMLGRFEVLNALFEGDPGTFADLVEETATFLEGDS